MGDEKDKGLVPADSSGRELPTEVVREQRGLWVLGGLFLLALGVFTSVMGFSRGKPTMLLAALPIAGLGLAGLLHAGTRIRVLGDGGPDAGADIDGTRTGVVETIVPEPTWLPWIAYGGTAVGVVALILVNGFRPVLAGVLGVVVGLLLAKPFLRLPGEDGPAELPPGEGPPPPEP